MTTRLLVIGYGNDLRRDDGVGRRAAEAVARWGLPGVHAVAVQQLTPELAELFLDADRVLFVDACADKEGVRVRLLEPGGTSQALGHGGDPRELLALSMALRGRCPEAWLITVPAADFGFGEGLSARGRRGLETALRHIWSAALCSSVSSVCGYRTPPTPAQEGTHQLFTRGT
jgi:hydrogenase maturation protease